MPLKFNPFSGNFDFTGSGGGGGGSAFFAGEVATYADLPLDGTAALNSRWLVRSSSGVWPFPGYHQGGIYVRVSTAGVDRDTDYLLADTNFPDVFSDAAFTVYDDADATRSMQIEVTDNETLTFKVTGTDSVVRSVALPLSAILAAALLFASSAMAQNFGLVRDTNGNVITRQAATNPLTFSNDLRFTQLTNADARIATISTNGTLGASATIPSGNSPLGAIPVSDGAGNAPFVEPRKRYFSRTSDLSRSNFNTLLGFHPTFVDDQLVSIPYDANATYELTYTLWFTTTAAAGFGARLDFSQTLAPSTHRSGVGQIHNTTISPLTSAGTFSVLQTAVTNTGTNVVIAGFFNFRTGTNAGTLELRWMAGASNSDAVTLNTGSAITLEKVSP